MPKKPEILFTIPVEDVVLHLKEIGEDLVWRKNLRRKLTIGEKTFKAKRAILFINHIGTTCVNCKLQGTHFVKTYHPNSEAEHFDLYHIDKKGNMILITVDHIYPKAKGGKDKLDNFQTMCFPCNEQKGDKVCFESGRDSFIN